MSDRDRGITQQGLFDFITSIDNILHTQTELLRDIRDKDVSGGGSDGGDGSTETEQKDAYSFSFFKNVTKDTQPPNSETETRNLHWDARIQTCYISWPPGPEFDVGVQLRTESGEKLLPRDDQSDYVRGDDEEHPFMLRHDLNEDDNLVAEFINEDAQNDHEVNVVVELEKR